MFLEVSNMKKKYIFGAVFIVCGLLLAFIPEKIAPVCCAADGAKMMKCFWTGRTLLGIGALIALLNGCFCFMKSGQNGIAAANILIALYAVAVQTFLIGTCKMPAMSCNTHTKPAVFLLAGLFIIANIFYLFLSRKDR